MEKKSTHIAAIALAAIMLATGILYLSIATDEYRSHQQEAHAATQTTENEAGENERASSPEQPESAGFGDMGEIVFFTIIGAAFITVGLWVVRTKEISRKPYLIALIGSAALIAFYVATRTVNIPMVGLQEDIGLPDLTAKMLQGIIVAIAGFMIFAISKQRKAQKLA